VIIIEYQQLTFPKGDNMKRLISVFIVILFLVSISSVNYAQQPKKPRASLKASVSQTIGMDANIKIDYSRPGVKGRKIWGELIPFGMNPATKESNNKPYPWRGGANENTTIELNKDVLVNGNKLPAGKYSLHFIPSEKDWVIIFNKKNDGWGSYAYNQDDDVFRITVTPVKAHHQEWLTYGFDDLTSNSATAFLQWEQLKVPFKITLPE
jgi:uncharacterized protein YuzE